MTRLSFTSISCLVMGAALALGISAGQRGAKAMQPKGKRLLSSAAFATTSIRTTRKWVRR